MNVRADLVPISRTAASKSGKKHVLFLCSNGSVDNDSLYTEADTVDCWLPGVVADVLTRGLKLEGEITVNGEFIMLNSFNLGNKKYTVRNKEVAIEDYEKDIIPDVTSAPIPDPNKGKITKV